MSSLLPRFERKKAMEGQPVSDAREKTYHGNTAFAISAQRPDCDKAPVQACPFYVMHSTMNINELRRAETNGVRKMEASYITQRKYIVDGRTTTQRNTSVCHQWRRQTFDECSKNRTENYSSDGLGDDECTSCEAQLITDAEERTGIVSRITTAKPLEADIHMEHSDGSDSSLSFVETDNDEM
ncbi:hypothetical protein Aduo_011990 [Ancylostoma duodenale]